MKITTSRLIRWAGLSAMMAGILFVVIQTIHPADILSSVTTSRWAIVHYLSIAMCLFGLLGIAGIYARQVEEAGWLGLAGYLLFSLFYALTMGFQFAEAFISPLLRDRVTEVCGEPLGARQWVRRRDEPRSPRNDIYACRGSVYARRPAVWHRDVPRRHPAAPGGRPVCLLRVRVGHRRLRCSHIRSTG